MSIDIVDGWEKRLVEDCRHIVWEAEVGVFKKWHEFGSRILKDEDYLSKRYGDSYTVHLAEKIEISEQSLWRSLQFVRKYPSWKDVEETLTRERMSWRDFIQKMLPNRPRSIGTVPLPEGKYRCLVIDPPWPMQKIEREVRPNQAKELDYPTMTFEEIADLPVPEFAVEDGCHVYLWITHRFLPDGLALFDNWGVNYQCVLTWVKNVGFTPYSWMYSTEHILFGRIGDLELLKLGKRLNFKANVREHSRKPNKFYKLVREVSPEPRLDMFSREKHEGFKQWGNEVDKFNAV